MLQRIVRHPILAPVAIAAGSLLISIALSIVAPLPQPQFHDEFSYLLAGDTFARGRLSNPPHRLWRFFETFQVLHTPTYASKYPPMQGLFLAMGQVLSDEPILGVWISTALACAAAWWALRGFTGPRLAAIGALIIALHPLILRWNWSYWGGAPAMIGGCLVVGAAIRFPRRFRYGSAVALGIGVGILLNSRPFEGTIALALCGAFALLRAGRRGVLRRAKPLAATIIVLLPIGAWMGYYNYRVTGSALKLPYTVYEKQYNPARPFLWLPPPRTTPTYGHPAIRDYYLGWELSRFKRQRTPRGLIDEFKERVAALANAYAASPVLLAPFGVALLGFRRRPAVRVAALIIALFLAAISSLTWFFPHYTAPVAVLFFLIVMVGLRRLAAGRRRALIPVVLLLHGAAAGAWMWNVVRAGESGWQFQRARILAAARNDGGNHLIFVRDTAAYAHNEWVYNEADIDNAQVIWARDLGDDLNRVLMQYHRGRTVWRLDIMPMGSQLVEYE